jgi:hypothetical protein
MPVDKDFDIRRLQRDNVSDLVKFHDTHCLDWNFLFSPEEVENRLKAGHRCFLARQNGEILGFTWFAINQVSSADLLCMFIIKNHCIVRYNSFIRPDARGKDLLPRLTATGFKEMNSEGYTICLTYNRSSNKSVIRSIRKFHAYPIGKIIYGYFLGYYFFFSFIKKDAGIEVQLSESPWHRWKAFFQKRFGK